MVPAPTGPDRDRWGRDGTPRSRVDRSRVTRGDWLRRVFSMTPEAYNRHIRQGLDPLLPQYKHLLFEEGGVGFGLGHRPSSCLGRVGRRWRGCGRRRGVLGRWTPCRNGTPRIV